MFDDWVISKKRAAGKKTWFTFPVSLAIHIFAIGFIVVASLWVVGGVQEPPINVIFAAPSAPPPPPPAPKKAPPKKEELPKETNKPRPIDPDAMIAPTIVPQEPPKEENAPVESTSSGEGVEGGVEGGIEGGTAGGVPGGLPGGEATPPPDEPIRIHTGVDKPEIVYKEDPRYPDVARAARVEGIVILEAIINKEGTVESVTVLRSIPLLDNAAIEAVKRWKFKPAKINGNPVKCYFTLTVRFKLVR